MSLPEVSVVRNRIESCKDLEIRMYLKSIYLFGARACELTGKRCSHSHTDIIYGPKGTDVHLSYTEPPDIPSKDLAKILITA